MDILPSLDITDFDVCIECLKGKTTKSSKKGSLRILECFLCRILDQI